MHVLLVIDGMHSRFGGPPAVVANSAMALAARGLKISVLSTVEPGEEAIVRELWADMIAAGVELYFCHNVTLLHLLRIRKLPKSAIELLTQADVIHFHGLWTPLYVVGMSQAILYEKPFLLSTHGVLDSRAFYNSKFKILKKLFMLEIFGLRKLVCQAQGLIFGSTAESDESIDIFPSVQKYYVPNGVSSAGAPTAVVPGSVELLDRLAPRRKDWRRTLLFFSRIHPEKGLDALVTAFNSLASDFPDTGLLIAGIADDERYQREIIDLINNGPAESQIVMTTELTGPRSHFVYSMCDIFILPSRAEGFSVALVQSLAYGIPSLSTRYCHMAVIQERGAGVVVDQDPKSIELGLRDMLRRPDADLKIMGTKARELFDERFSLGKVADLLQDIYRSASATIPV